MKVITAGALLMIFIITAPAYAQTNTELLYRIDNNVEDISDNMGIILRDISVVISDIRDVLDEIIDITPTLADITESITIMSGNVNNIQTSVTANTESITNIENMMAGEACGIGTKLVAGVCVANIIKCADGAKIVDGTCEAAIECGDGTLQHLNTCIADISISYCGEGTTFSGGKCIAGTSETTADIDIDPEPTRVMPDETSRFIEDGNKIKINSGQAKGLYTLAFAESPELKESGGREAAQYLEALCESGPISIYADTSQKAIIECGGVDASQAMVLSGHADFIHEDCGIRKFLNIGWTQELCKVVTHTSVVPIPVAPIPVAPTPVTPIPVAPIRGNLAVEDFIFPVTVGDVLKWPTASDGDPYADIMISCLFEHTPTRITAIIADNTAGVYNIGTSGIYTGTEREDTEIRLTKPTNKLLFAEQFHTGGTSYSVYNVPGDILAVGMAKDYTISVSLADWDDTSWATNALAATAAEKAQKLFDLRLDIQTDITNMECALGNDLITGPRDSYSEFVVLTAIDSTGLEDIIKPIQVTCSENITITQAAGSVHHDNSLLTGYDTITITDISSDDNIVIILGGDIVATSFQSDSFTIGDGDRLVFEKGKPPKNSLAVLKVTYNATSADVCTWG